MDENPLAVHDGNDFSFVNAATPSAFNSHILSGLSYIFFERNGTYRIQEALSCAGTLECQRHSVSIVSATLGRT
jgi:hypothetical protein